MNLGKEEDSISGSEGSNDVEVIAVVQDGKTAEVSDILKTGDSSNLEDGLPVVTVTDAAEGALVVDADSSAKKNAAANAATKTIDIEALNLAAKKDVIYDYCVLQCIPVTELAKTVRNNIWRKARPFVT